MPFVPLVRASLLTLFSFLMLSFLGSITVTSGGCSCMCQMTHMLGKYASHEWQTHVSHVQITCISHDSPVRITCMSHVQSHACHMYRSHACHMYGSHTCHMYRPHECHMYGSHACHMTQVLNVTVLSNRSSALFVPIHMWRSAMELYTYMVTVLGMQSPT